MQERVQYGGREIKDNLHLRKLVRDIKNYASKNPESRELIWNILIQALAAMKLVQSPLYNTDPPLDEKEWDMEDKYECDRSQVDYALTMVPEELREMLSEELYRVFGESQRVFVDQVCENIWMRMALPWAHSSCERRRSDQLIWVRDHNTPLREEAVKMNLVNDFPLTTTYTSDTRDIMHELALVFRRQYSILAFEDPTLVEVREDLTLVDEL